MIDTLLLSVPRIAPVRPQAAPAVLKGICNKLGMTSKVLDLNQDFFLGWGKGNYDAITAIDEYFVVFHHQLTPKVKAVYDDWIESWVEKILSYDTKYIGISVFSWQSQRFVRDLLAVLRPRTNSIIYIGGQGLVHSQNLSANWSNRATFAWEMLDSGQIDYFLKGESEETFERFMQGERNMPGVNNDSIVKFHNLDTAPLQDFSDLDVRAYQNGYAAGVLPIESSRGCVRSCSFCEMSSEHGDYRGKSGIAVANEMIAYYKTYGVRDFYFHDDLMNGNLKDFNNMMHKLIEWYTTEELGDAFFSFSGYWIIRNRTQFDEDSWALLARAGGNLFVTGVETGSDRLRKIVRKGFTNKDLDFNLAQITKHKMKFYFMLVSGVPGETLEDFNDTLNMLSKYQKYVATGTIIGVNLGTTATIEEGTDLFKNPDRYKLVGLNGKLPQGINWMCTDTPELDYKERVRRRVLVQEHVTKLGYPLWKGDDHLRIIKDQYILNKTEWEQYRSGLIM